MPSTALLSGSPLDGDFATQKAGSKEEEEPSSPSPSCSSTPILLCPSTDPSTVPWSPYHQNSISLPHASYCFVLLLQQQ